jgi:RHS repeat-associated protein
LQTRQVFCCAVRTWDDNGNLTNDGVRTYTYDAANRLTAVSGSPASSFAYDGLGNRTSMTAGGATTHYALDVAGGLPEVIAATGGATTHYLQVQGQVLAQYDSGTWGYVLPDALGSVRTEADASGQVAAARSFDPFGVPLGADGGDPFGYTGEPWDSQTELLYLRARYYEPETGRFLGQDSWTGDITRPQSIHPYVYGLNNPVKYRDPSGHDVNCPGQDASECVFKPEEAQSPTEIVDNVENDVYATQGRLIDAWFEAHPGYDVFQDPEVWQAVKTDTGYMLRPNPVYEYTVLYPYFYWRWGREEGELVAEQSMQQTRQTIDWAGVIAVVPAWAVPGEMSPLALPPGKAEPKEQHHVFKIGRPSRDLEMKFKQLGIDPDLYCVDVPASSNPKGGADARAWRQWLNNNPSATRAEIFKQGGWFLYENEVDGNYIVGPQGVVHPYKK